MIKKILKYSLFLIPLLLIYIIRPIKIIRFQKLSTEVIGSFAETTETYLCKKKINYEHKKNYLDCFCYGLIANNQLAQMVKKKIIVLPRYLLEPIIVLNGFFSKYITTFKIHEINLKNYRDINDLYSKYSPNLEFTDDELKLGESTLLEMGIEKNSKYICFDIRDDAYKKKNHYLIMI